MLNSSYSVLSRVRLFFVFAVFILLLIGIINGEVAYHMHDTGATGWGLLDMHRARRPPFLFRGGVNLPPPRPIGKAAFPVLFRLWLLEGGDLNVTFTFLS
jgi:hypothetical protein